MLHLPRATIESVAVVVLVTVSGQAVATTVTGVVAVVVVVIATWWWWNNEWLARLLAAMAYQSYYMQQRAVGIMTIMIMIMAVLYVSMLVHQSVTTERINLICLL